MLIGAVYMSANATQVILLFWTGLTLRLKAALEGEYYQCYRAENRRDRVATDRCGGRIRAFET